MSAKENKILNYMMKGPIQYNQVGRTIEVDLLIEAMMPDYKNLAKIIKEYFVRYKSPPTYELIEGELLNEIEDLEVLTYIKAADCAEGEYAYYVDKIKERYKLFLAKNLADSILSSDDYDTKDLSSSVSKVSSKLDRLTRSSVFSEGDFSESADDRIKNYKYIEENPGAVSGILTGYRQLDE